MEIYKTQLQDEDIIKLTTLRPYIAIASLKGLFINLEIAECEVLRIYKPGNKNPELIDIRPVPEDDICEKRRWKQLASLLEDCACLLVHGIAPEPQSVLMSSGVQVLVVEGFVDKAISKIGEGKSIHFMDIKNVNNRRTG
jgi:nitrogen fixation protein NifB